MNFFQILVILTLAVLPAIAVTVRVQPTPGGSQIHVNGKPVPPSNSHFDLAGDE